MYEVFTNLPMTVLNANEIHASSEKHHKVSFSYYMYFIFDIIMCVLMTFLQMNIILYIIAILIIARLRIVSLDDTVLSFKSVVNFL